jgi:hypothetical protein
MAASMTHRWAPAASQERHRLAVSGHPSEPDQDADQQRHRDRQSEGLRDEGQEHASRRGPRDPLGNQLLELLHDRGDIQQEREDQQRQDRRRDDFADDVSVEDFHGRLQDTPQTANGPTFNRI